MPWRRARLQSVVAGRLAAALRLVCIIDCLACSFERARANYHLQPALAQKRFSGAELHHWVLRAFEASELADLPAVTYEGDLARWSTVTTTYYEMHSVLVSTARYQHQHQHQHFGRFCGAPLVWKALLILLKHCASVRYRLKVIIEPRARQAIEGCGEPFS